MGASAFFVRRIFAVPLMPRMRRSMRSSAAGVDEIGLVEQHQVREGHLLGRLVELVDVLLEMFGVHHRDDGVELELVLELVVEEEGLRHRARDRPCPWSR